jgi:hypothetical protein
MPRPKAVFDRREQATVPKAQILSAEQFAATVRPVIASLQKAGVTSYRGIAAALNSRGVRMACGGQWQVSNVRNLRTQDRLSFRNANRAASNRI